VNTRDLRWRDEDPALPEDLRGWLREGGAPLGDASEVADLRQRLARVLGPASGLGGGEPPSGDVPSQGGGGSGATPAAEPAASTSARLERGAPLAPPSGADAPPSGVDAPPSGASAPPLAPSAARPRLGRGARAALGGAAVALGVSVYAWRASAPPAAPAPSTAIAGAGSLPPAAPPSVAPPAQAPAPTATPAPADAVQSEPPSSAAEGRATPPDAPRRARSKLPRPPQIGEATLLERARHELGKSPARALAMTREHEQRFPRGVLVQEREVIAIEALKRLGRTGPAAARAAEFERRYRGSVHQPRLLRGSDTSAPAGGASSTPVP